MFSGAMTMTYRIIVILANVTRFHRLISIRILLYYLLKHGEVRQTQSFPFYECDIKGNILVSFNIFQPMADCLFFMGNWALYSAFNFP